MHRFLLCNNSKRCIGVDINKDGIKYLKNNLGYEDVLCGDIIEELNAIKERTLGLYDIGRNVRTY